MKILSSILAMKFSTNMFGLTKRVAVTYSKIYSGKGKLINHVVKRSKLAEGL
jgi:hypothetical protein